MVTPEPAAAARPNMGDEAAWVEGDDARTIRGGDPKAGTPNGDDALMVCGDGEGEGDGEAANESARAGDPHGVAPPIA